MPTTVESYMDRVFQAGQLTRDPVARAIVDHLRTLEEPLQIRGGTLYYDFPIFRDDEDKLYRSHVMIASMSHGVLLITGSDATEATFDENAISDADDQITQLSRIIFGMLLKSRLLSRGLRDIKVNLRSIFIFPHLQATQVDNLQITSEAGSFLTDIDEALRANKQDELTLEEWAELRAILEGAKGLVRPRERAVPKDRPNSRGAILNDLDREIANFDLDQRRAALNVVEGPQRIRGLAGSGKTVILAYKAAHLHLKNPDALILYTFYTKSLYDFVKRLITRFYRQFIDHDPDWNRIHIRHAWGGRNVEGVYYNACLDAGVPPMNLQQAQSARPDDAFGYICGRLLESGRVRQRYDYILMDEAQDYPSSFYQLCFELTKGGPVDRNVVWAYDELQTIFNVKVQAPEDAFGSKGGRAVMDLERASERSGGYGQHDIVLRRCYRNPREVLVTAHAVGFGLYSDTIVQMLEDAEHWRDVGYELESGACVPGERVTLNRPEENSPLTISARQTKDELVRTCVFESVDEEVAAIADEVEALIADGVRADEIMVISLDDRHARLYFSALAPLLASRHIDINNALDSPYRARAFARENAVTLSTVYRAKGNEAAAVFAIGVDALLPMRRSRVGRNRLFTALTRAKAWLWVSGLREGARFFAEEIQKALANSPRLQFQYPDPKTVETLQRDLSDKYAKLDRVMRELEQLDLLDEAEEFLKVRGQKKE